MIVECAVNLWQIHMKYVTPYGLPSTFKKASKYWPFFVLFILGVVMGVVSPKKLAFLLYADAQNKGEAAQLVAQEKSLCPSQRE